MSREHPPAENGPCRLHLLRHARCAGQGQLIGRSDPALADAGRAQARVLRDELAGLRPARVACSPLRRCRETLERIAAPDWPEPEFRDDLREVDFGRWEGADPRALAAEGDAAVAAWARCDPDFAFPDGESLRAFDERVGGAIAQLTRGASDILLVVTHGGVIRRAIGRLLGFGIAHDLRFAIGAGHIASLDCYPDGGGLLRGFGFPGAAAWAD